jgi:2,3-bisphosphoglycerate-independent phosphoglycerate mutase
MKRTAPLVLAILDGWGERADPHGNAIANATLPNWQRLLDRHPHTTLAASGEAVGLPAGVMGNSEVGHINIGSGRVVEQGLVVIDAAIAEGALATNPVLEDAIAHVRANAGTLHFFGLLSDGKVHSSLDHLEAFIAATTAAGVRFAIDAFLDGRDTPPRSAQAYIDRIEAFIAAHAARGRFTSITGRFYAMDRDKRWERIEQAYALLAHGASPHRAPTASASLAAAYERGENDEFVLPTIVGEAAPIADGDAVIFFNYRPDRGRELTLAFSDARFSHFSVQPYANLMFATMTRYDDEFANPVLFGPRPQSHTFGEVVAAAGLSQLRLAETEKYAHVTYFFNGGREEVFANEDRVLIPSNRSVPTYDHAPEMSANDITSAAIEDVERGHHDVIVLNYANADMVGHTGVWEATISAVETIDQCLGRLERAVRAAGGILAITADHGNAEEELDAAGNVLTAHTTNPVPFVLISETPLGTLTPGKLGDIAPTLLPLLGLAVPPEMTGTNLLVPASTPA